MDQTSSGDGLLGARHREQRTRWALYAAFGLSGVATTMLGPLLPALSSRWSMVDAQAAALFGAQFAGSTLGAALASYHRERSIVGGYLLMAASIAGLAFAGHGEALLALFLMGVGLGQAVTATNIAVGSRSRAGSAASLSLLNLIWGAGAVLGPELFLAAQRAWSLRAYLLCLSAAMLAAVAGVVADLASRPLAGADQSDATEIGARRNAKRYLGSRPGSSGAALEQPRAGATRPILRLGMLLFLYVGTENCVNGWVTTLDLRYAGHREGTAIAATTLFWIAILLSRGLLVPALRKRSHHGILAASVAAGLAGTLLLASARSPLLLAVGATVAGAGFGPVFPLLLSSHLRKEGASKELGWAFSLAGCGSATLPWLTGIVSTAFGSLRAGFAVPAAAVAVLLTIILASKDVPKAARPN